MAPLAAHLRKKFAPRLRPLHVRSAPILQGALTLLWHIGLGVAVALTHKSLISSAWAHTSPAFGLGATFVAWILIGTRMRALGNMMHECVHGTFVRGRKANHMFGFLIGLIDFTCYPEYRHEHLTHHTHLGHPLRDLDFARRRTFGFASSTQVQVGGNGAFEPRTKIVDKATHRQVRFWLKWLLLPLALWPLFRLFRPVFYTPRDPLGWRLVRLGYVFAMISVFCFFEPFRSAFVQYFLIPYCTTYQLLKFWSDAADHAGLLSAGDEFLRSRNHILPGGTLLNRVFFPRHDEYHLVHHLFPQVPTRHLPECHTLLLQEASYAERSHSFF